MTDQVTDQAAEGVTVVTAETLRTFIRHVLLAVGMPPAAADITADAMVWADLRAIEPHGVAKLPILVERIVDGVTSPDAEPSVLAETATTALLDAGTAWGQVAATWAMELAVEKARVSQLGAVVVRNSSSLGALGYYPLVAVRAGQIGLAITNSMPLLAPWGGTQKLLGNQGYAIGCPAGRYPPLLLDTSNSATSWGNVRLAAERGEQLAPGLAFDAAGRPTTDPAAALEGLLAPAGGHKGFGLALMWEILTGVLAGLAFGPNVGALEDLSASQQVSHFLLAIDPTAYLPLDQLTSRVDSLIEQIHAVPPAPGASGPYAPGEQGAARAAIRERDGIPLSPRRRAEIAAVGQRVGVEPPFTPAG
jgi:LDH2 family malate/lactate/ureidoglycolate dehydrogenase